MEAAIFLYKLMIGMLGVFSLLVILWAARNVTVPATTAWAVGGAVAVAAAGIFGLLLALAKF